MTHELLPLLLAFLGVSVLATLVPGPDTVVVIRNAVAHGPRAAVATAAGCSTGQVGWGIASVLGIAAVLATSVVAFTVVKWAGAAYLCYLGIRSLLAAVRRGEAVEHGSAATPVRGVAAYRTGLLTNALNPKTALFMSALLPQFLAPGDPVWLAFVLVAITAVASFACMAGYAMVFAGVGDVLRRPRMRRTIDGTTGVVLVGFGVGLATSRT